MSSEKENSTLVDNDKSSASINPYETPTNERRTIPAHLIAEQVIPFGIRPQSSPEDNFKPLRNDPPMYRKTHSRRKRNARRTDFEFQGLGVPISWPLIEAPPSQLNIPSPPKIPSLATSERDAVNALMALKRSQSCPVKQEPSDWRDTATRGYHPDRGVKVKTEPGDYPYEPSLFYRSGAPSANPQPQSLRRVHPPPLERECGVLFPSKGYTPVAVDRRRKYEKDPEWRPGMKISKKPRLTAKHPETKPKQSSHPKSG